MHEGRRGCANEKKIARECDWEVGGYKMEKKTVRVETRTEGKGYLKESGVGTQMRCKSANLIKKRNIIYYIVVEMALMG